MSNLNQEANFRVPAGLRWVGQNWMSLGTAAGFGFIFYNLIYTPLTAQSKLLETTERASRIAANDRVPMWRRISNGGEAEKAHTEADGFDDTIMGGIFLALLFLVAVQFIRNGVLSAALDKNKKK